MSTYWWISPDKNCYVSAMMVYYLWPATRKAIPIPYFHDHDSKHPKQSPKNPNEEAVQKDRKNNQQKVTYFMYCIPFLCFVELKCSV